MSELHIQLDLLDTQYTIATVDDEHAVKMLDYWLEDWLYRKAQCPCCGEDL